MFDRTIQFHDTIIMLRLKEHTNYSCSFIVIIHLMQLTLFVLTRNSGADALFNVYPWMESAVLT
jgi:hypothetical protein